MMASECCRLCLSFQNVINVFSDELTNSERLRKYIFQCSGVNILATDIITKCICHTCCETIKNILKFRNVAITNDLSLKHIFLQECNINRNNVNDLDVEEVFKFLPYLQAETKENKEDLNILNFDTKVHTVDLDLTQNNMNDWEGMPTQVPENLDTLETSETGKGTEVNWDESNDMIIKEEPVVMVNGLAEDVEVESLKREIVSDDEDESPETLNEEMSNEKEERNEQEENKVNLDIYKPVISKEIITVLEDCLSKKNEIRTKTSNKFADGGIPRTNPLKNPKANKDDFNILSYDTKVHTMDLDLTQNTIKDLKSISTKVPEDLDVLETSETGKRTEINWDESNELIIKEETVVMSIGLEEDIEVGKEADESLKREIVSNDEDESPKILNEQMSSEKEEKNEQGENEINLDKYKHIINKEIIIVLKDFLSEKNEKRAKTSKKSRTNHLKELRTNKLNTHLNVHSDNKEYECSECGKHFSKSRNLNIHRFTHSGEKPHKCPDCGQCFRRRDSLVRHQLIHSGEKPHKCSDCGQCFRRRDSLVRHRRIHSGERPYKLLT